MAVKGIVKGKTSTGFKYSVKKAMLNNAEFLEAFAKVQNGDNLKMFDLMDIAFGEEQKKALYDHVRDKDGIVPLDTLATEIAEIFEELGRTDEEIKN